SIREQRRTMEAGDLVRHTIRVLEQITVVLQRVSDAESGQRGYVLTGDPSYLKPYHDATAPVPQDFADLGSLTSCNPSQQARFESLAPLISAKLEEMRLVVSQRESGDAAGALDTIRGGVGKDVMDQIRRNLADASADERHLLRERVEQRESLSGRATS